MGSISPTILMSIGWLITLQPPNNWLGFARPNQKLELPGRRPSTRFSMKSSRQLAALLALTAHLWADSPKPAGSEKIDFRRDIEPIFVKRCSECHGPDKQKNNLRLDVKADAFKGGKSGKPTIVPGKSAESEIIIRVTSTDPDEVMPSKGEPLTPEQIAALRTWIDQGAVWPESDPKKHWAFLKPIRP